MFFKGSNIMNKKAAEIKELRLILSGMGFNSEQVNKVSSYVNQCMAVDDAIENISELLSYFSRYDFTNEESATLISKSTTNINFKQLERGGKFIKMGDRSLHPLVISTYHLMETFECEKEDILNNPLSLHKFDYDKVEARHYLLLKMNIPKKARSKDLTMLASEFNTKYQINQTKYLMRFHDEVVRSFRKLNSLGRDPDNLRIALSMATHPAEGHKVQAADLTRLANNPYQRKRVAHKTYDRFYSEN